MSRKFGKNKKGSMLGSMLGPLCEGRLVCVYDSVCVCV